MESLQVLKHALYRRRRSAAELQVLNFVAHQFKNLERSNPTLDDKLRIIDYYREHEGLPGVTQALEVQHLRIEYPTLSQSTLSSYLSRKKEIQEYIDKNPNRLACKKPTRVALPQIKLALTE
ncbi:hypothetical protein RhiTH_010745 [Rhizoctonia solani]